MIEYDEFLALMIAKKNFVADMPSDVMSAFQVSNMSFKDIDHEQNQMTSW